MKQLAMLVAAGFVTLMLSACGDDHQRPAEVRTDTTVVQPAEGNKKVEDVKAPVTTETQKSE